MTTGTNHEGTTLINRIFEEVFNQKRLDAIDELFAEDYVEHHPMQGDISGREAFKQFVQAWFTAFPDGRSQVSDIAGEGDIAYWTVRITGTNSGEFGGMPATGKRIDIVGLNKGRIRDGRAAEHWTGNDMLQLMGQLGLMPPQQG